MIWILLCVFAMISTDSMATVAKTNDTSWTLLQTAEARSPHKESCNESSQAFAGGKVKFLPIGKEIWKDTKKLIPSYKGEHGNIFIQISEVGSFKNSTSHKMIDLLITGHINVAAVDGIFDFFHLRRYLVSPTGVMFLSQGEIPFVGFFGWNNIKAAIEVGDQQLLRIFNASEITTSPLRIEGYDKPLCNIKLGNSTLAFNQANLNNSKKLTEHKIGTLLVKTAQNDPAFYSTQKDNVLLKYVYKDALSFNFRNNQYKCFPHLPTTGSLLTQDFHQLVTIDPTDLKKIGSVESMGSVYEMLHNKDQKEHAEFYTDYENSYDITERTINNLSSDPEWDERLRIHRKNLGEKKTRDQINGFTPIVYIKDPLERFYRCQADSLLPDTSWYAG